MNRDHSVVFEIPSKYCILDSIVDCDGYSISSKGFLPTVVDIMDGGSWHCTGDRNQDDPQEKEMQKSKIALWEGLTNSCEKGSRKQRRNGKK